MRFWAYCSVCKKSEEVSNYTVAHYHLHDGVRYVCELSYKKITPPKGEKKNVPRRRQL